VVSALPAAVAAGAYPDIHTAARAMGKVRRAVYVPDDDRARSYDALFAEYTTLHDYFGRPDRPGRNDVMHRLRRIRREALR
jgi:L-ribulokinase